MCASSNASHGKDVRKNVACSRFCILRQRSKRLTIMETTFAPSVACTHCRKNFFFNANPGVGGSRMPVILPCGHAICVLCGGSFRDGLQCRECGIVAHRRLDMHRTGFPPHLGIMGGLILISEARQKQPPFPGPQYLPAGAPLSGIKSKKKTLSVPEEKSECDVCQFDLAIVNCIKCAKNYCQKCLSKRHGPAEQTTHRVIALSGQTFQPSAPQAVQLVPIVKPRIFCATHTEQRLEFLCQDCDVAICAYCNLLQKGEHQGHQIAFMGDLGPKYEPKIKELVLEAQEVRREQENTIKVLHLGEHQPADWDAVDKQISEHIAWQFAQVQLYGMRLRAKLADAKAASGERRKLIDGVVQSLERNKGLAACSKSYEPRESLWLLQSLEEACAAPCRLYKRDDIGSVRFSVDKEVFLDAMDLGAVLEIPDDLGLAVFPRCETVADGWTLHEGIIDQAPLPEVGAVSRDLPAPRKEAASALLAALEQPSGPKGIQSRASSVCSSLGSIGEVDSLDAVHGFIAPGTSEVVKISHVVDLSDFYVIRLADVTFRDRLSKKIQSMFRKLAVPETVDYGNIVLAKYAGDGRWYRALVCSVEPPAPHVLFIDYGNEGQVDQGCIRSLPPALATVPPLAIHCCLHKAHPRGGGEWSNAAIQWFVKIADGNWLTCRVYSVENGLVNVDVGEVVGAKPAGLPLSVADAAVFMQFAQYIAVPAVNDLEMDLPSSFERPPVVAYPVPRRWRLDECFAAQVAHVETADCFYVHRQDRDASAKIVCHNEELTALCQPLFNAAGDGENLPVHLPVEGLACAAHFSVDAMWYRALVTEVLPERRVKVFFVDYGNSDEVSNDDIRRLPERFTKIPPLAIECRLYGIEPSDGTEVYSSEAAAMVDNLTEGQVIEITVQKILDASRRYEVVVINSAGVNVARELTRSKLAVRVAVPGFVQSEDSDEDGEEDSEVVVLPQTLEHCSGSALSLADEIFPLVNGLLPLDDQTRRDQAVLEDIVHMPIRPESITDGSLTEIVFVKCVTPDQMFISIKSAIYHFNDMKVSMDLFYAKSKPTDRSWTPGDRCAALHSADRKWHRGIVREVDEVAAVALIELRDIVCRERVPLSLLRPLDESFMRVREAIFPVSIGGVVPAGGSEWTHKAGEFAVRWTGIHKPTHIIKRGEITDGRLPVELLARETVLSGPLDPAVERFVSLNKELVANGLALPVRGVQEWPLWSSVEVTQEVEQSKEAVDWTFPDQVKEDPPEADLWPGVPTDRSLQPGSWLPIEAVDMVAFEAIPTNVDNNGYIYLHSIHAESTLISMTAQLQRRFDAAPPPAGEFALRPGMPCVTRYHLDNLWYRAETVKELSDGCWEVIFVDYGSLDTLPSREIWPTTFLAEIPVLCRKVALANVRPISEDGRWTRDGLDTLHVNVVEKQCTVHVRSPEGTPDPTTVVLVRGDGTEIGSLLVVLGVARYAKVTPGMVPGLSPLSIKRKRRSRKSRSSGDSDRSSEHSTTPRTIPEPESREELSSPDIIECSDEEDDEETVGLVKLPIGLMSLEECFDPDVASEEVYIKIDGKLDNTVAVTNQVEFNGSVDSIVDGKSKASDDKIDIAGDKSSIISEKSTNEEDYDDEVLFLGTGEGVTLNSEKEIIFDSDDNEDDEDNTEDVILDARNELLSDLEDCENDHKEDVSSSVPEDGEVSETKESIQEVPAASSSQNLSAEKLEASRKEKDKADDDKEGGKGVSSSVPEDGEVSETKEAIQEVPAASSSQNLSADKLEASRKEKDKADDDKEGSKGVSSSVPEDGEVSETKEAIQEVPAASSSLNLSVDKLEASGKEKDAADSAVALKFQHHIFPKATSVEVVMQSVESLQAVRVIPRDPLSMSRLEKLKELKALMQKEAPMQPLLVKRTFPLCCAAQFGDGQWGRAIFSGLRGADLMVWDVDTSAYEKVSPDRVCECRREWTTLPALMANAVLSGFKLAPGVSVKAGQDALARALLGKTFTASVLARKPTLTLKLYVKGTKTLAIEPLIASGILEVTDM